MSTTPRWRGTGAGIVLVLVVVLGSGGAALLGSWSAVPSPPAGTVRLPAGVPEQVRELRVADRPGEYPDLASSVAVFRRDGLLAHLTADHRTLAFTDPVTGARSGAVALPDAVGELAPTPGGRTAYVGDHGGVLRTLDLDARAVTGAVVVGGRPDVLAVSPDGRVYVGDAAGDTVTVVDPVARRVVARWPVGRGVSDLAVAPDGDRLVVLRRDAGVVALLDTASGRTVATAAVRPGTGVFASGTTAVAVGRDVAYVAGAGGVTVLDLERGAAAAPRWTNGPVLSLSLSPDGRYLHVLGHVDGDDQEYTPDLPFTTVDTVGGQVLGRTNLGTPTAGDLGSPALTESADGRRLLLASEDGYEIGGMVLDLR